MTYFVVLLGVHFDLFFIIHRCWFMLLILLVALVCFDWNIVGKEAFFAISSSKAIMIGMLGISAYGLDFAALCGAIDTVPDRCNVKTNMELAI